MRPSPIQSNVIPNPSAGAKATSNNLLSLPPHIKGSTPVGFSFSLIFPATCKLWPKPQKEGQVDAEAESTLAGFLCMYPIVPLTVAS
jgi:hypothetical protein